ncbi:PIR protein, putative [Plasmodium sp. gorilla clade G1]|nr:PIR protein, putative [Plasmodium sp. gorilla clade G1]
MKFYNFKLSLYSLLLNILLILSHVHNKKKAYFTTQHTSNTKSIKPHRSLCECELYDRYIPIYDYNQEMKEVMQQFDERTSQRFREYDERMQEKRQICKEQCDKDMQKIILKDKIEKELTEKLSALQTDISINDIPTCICEKSLADKMEKNCLKCGGILGTAVPELPLLGEISAHILTNAATSAATKAGMKAAVDKLNELIIMVGETDVDLKLIVTESSYNNASALFQNATKLVSKTCALENPRQTSRLCNTIIRYGETSTFNDYAQAGSTAYETTLEAKMAEIPTFNTAMTASIIAIVVIVLIMVIIYLILRYRRKKKMKKKVQYMKLLKE